MSEPFPLAVSLCTFIFQRHTIYPLATGHCSDDTRRLQRTAHGLSSSRPTLDRMTDLIRIVQAQASFMSLLVEKKNVAADASGLENLSATHIQRLFRGTRIRIDVSFKRCAVESCAFIVFVLCC